MRFTYIGSHTGVEGRLCEAAGISFEAIQTGKFRRYWDLRNFFDIFRVGMGMVQAFFKLLRLRPKVVFSKGGFVGFPVVFAAWLIGIPVITHESDAIPGLATRLSAPFVKKILLGYEEAAEGLDRHKHKLEFTGNPVRLSLFDGDVERGKKWTSFSGDKPVLLVMGGSSGSTQLNEHFEEEKEKLTEVYDVVHLTGTLQRSGSAYKKNKHYFALPFAGEGMKDLYALTSVAISRAGANSLAELEALQIPALLFPLGRHASRGDQKANAEALTYENSLYRIGEVGKSLASQLLLLPRRSAAKANEPLEPKNNATQKIAFTLLAV